jgi:hypothetical protein
LIGHAQDSVTRFIKMSNGNWLHPPWHFHRFPDYLRFCLLDNVCIEPYDDWKVTAIESGKHLAATKL